MILFKLADDSDSLTVLTPFSSYCKSLGFDSSNFRKRSSEKVRISKIGNTCFYELPYSDYFYLLVNCIGLSDELSIEDLLWLLDMLFMHSNFEQFKSYVLRIADLIEYYKKDKSSKCSSNEEDLPF